MSNQKIHFLHNAMMIICSLVKIITIHNCFFIQPSLHLSCNTSLHLNLGDNYKSAVRLMYHHTLFKEPHFWLLKFCHICLVENFINIHTNFFEEKSFKYLLLFCSLTYGRYFLYVLCVYIYIYIYIYIYTHTQHTYLYIHTYTGIQREMYMF